MLRWFICPDNERIGIDYCLAGCRMSSRCMSRRTLAMIADERKWTGIPSTTMLLDGTMLTYLKLTTDYAIAPLDSIWAIHGSKVHDALERYSENALSEIRLTDDTSSGQFDYYDAETCTLFDTKTWGSYKVAKALGIVAHEVETGEVYKSGEKKGQPKTRKEYRQTGTPDLFNETLQLNDYRIKLESAGFPVKAMQIEAIPRDGGTYVAAGRGIDKNAYMIDVPILPDEEVKGYFLRKRDNLFIALENGWTEPCDSRESWEGRRCVGYCPVAEECKRRASE